MTFLRSTLALMLVMVAVLLAAGCAGQVVGGEKAAPDNQTRSHLTRVFTMATPVPGDPSFSSSGTQTEYSIGNIRSVLKSWNENMYWNLSSARIEDYAASMENGILKKYRTNPDYPHLLNIPDKQQFRWEAGMALGFTDAESEEFVLAMKQYDQDEWGMLDCRDYVNNSPCPRRTIPINFSVKPRLIVTS